MMSYQGSPYSGHLQDDYDFEDDGYDDYDEYRDNEEPPPSLPMDDSDEDTEEASETDMANTDEPLEIKERMYQDKLASLKKQLEQLKDGTHSEYNRRVKRLEHQYHERLRLNKLYKEHMLDCAEREYIAEKKAAAKEFEEKKIELKENLLSDFEDKRKHIESERHTMELNGDSMEVKPAMTRKLRRRPNEPAPVPEKRRKPPTTNLAFLLDERDVELDLKAINKPRPSSNSSSNVHSPPHHHHQRHHQSLSNLTSHISTLPPRKHTNSNCESPSREGNGTARAPSPSTEARVEDGKLLYERRWYHRGQSIYVEGRDITRFPGHITAITSDAIWVKKSNVGNEAQKMRIYTSQLARGKVTIKRRAS